MHTEAAAPPRTLFQKIWDDHKIVEREDLHTLLYVDRHYVYDGSSSRVAFELLAERGLPVRRVDRTFGAADHFVPTLGRTAAEARDAERRFMIEAFDQAVATHGIVGFGLGDPRQGIVHVVGPEQGLTQPGMIVVCGDSHTSTNGALGALAFGIGASEVCHVLATSTIWQRPPREMRITVDGTLGNGVTAKDLILAIIAKIGTAGATGCALEYAGSAVRALSIEGRLTICNMSIEAGARFGHIAPDEKTLGYLAGRPFAPRGADWDAAAAFWRTLPSDSGAVFDREVFIDAAGIAPMVTWGTSPEDASPISGRVPDPADAPDAARRSSIQRALDYMDLVPGTPLTEIAVDRVFIGSCTNGRIEDLREAATFLDGRKVAPSVRAMVSPGSTPVKRQAEAEGLDRIFLRAGFEWRESGCSMCLGVNGDEVAPGERCASTSNRNFVGRQGPGARTHLVSPAMAAAAAVAGHFVDVRQLADRAGARA
jgi:3-isopropylmalate/(R)-2-methylmalate dehydratase large subunit